MRAAGEGTIALSHAFRQREEREGHDCPLPCVSTTGREGGGTTALSCMFRLQEDPGECALLVEDRDSDD